MSPNDDSHVFQLPFADDIHTVDNLRSSLAMNSHTSTRQSFNEEPISTTTSNNRWPLAEMKCFADQMFLMLLAVGYTATGLRRTRHGRRDG